MLINFILQLIVSFLAMLLSRFPTITTLPFGIDEILVTGVGGYRALAVIFPPLDIVLTAFLIYLGFRIGLRIFRMLPVFGKLIHD